MYTMMRINCDLPWCISADRNSCCSKGTELSPDFLERFAIRGVAGEEKAALATHEYPATPQCLFGE